ncbi:CBS domain-containing protein [Streptomyces sporangiiformans]|uniref:CBS domain-containing protein n=1 Tax=Streptomyces sporangiiformans TaxID=2315329 RepID=A0A505D7J8_9ACTN|nr:CBS domain-containing protein [Streptomyces sporangiiformans]TPQ15476.1 CBS domain-containing protein [Streptomyces sporangiiformans]
MAQHVREVMTTEPVTVDEETPLPEVARLMKEKNIGDVIVAEEDRVRGLVTDRDLVVRVLAEERDPARTTVREVASTDLITIDPEAEIDEAVRLMRENALRRLPVVEEGHLVGALSIGDLALERDPRSALADISAAEPNR